MIRLSFWTLSRGFGDPGIQNGWLLAWMRRIWFWILLALVLPETYISPVAKWFSRLISPYASHLSISPCACIAQHRFMLWKGGRGVTNPFQIPPGPTYRRGVIWALLGIFHAVNCFQTWRIITVWYATFNIFNHFIWGYQDHDIVL